MFLCRKVKRLQKLLQKPEHVHTVIYLQNM